MKNVSVYGIYPSEQQTQNGVNALTAAGFRHEDISVLFADRKSTKEFAHENSTKAPEGATTGALTGGSIGGLIGWFAGIGSLAIPGVGPLIAAGPILGMLAGAGAGGALGGLAGALIGYGIPEYEAKRYEGHINEGGVLLSVHADNSDWADKAEEILEDTGATDIGQKAEASSEKSNTSDQNSRSMNNSNPTRL